MDWINLVLPEPSNRFHPACNGEAAETTRYSLLDPTRRETAYGSSHSAPRIRTHDTTDEDERVGIFSARTTQASRNVGRAAN